jgi:uncharacterized protein YpmB
MRTRNEKILLALVGIIVFVGANISGYRWLAQKQHDLEMSRAEIKADQAEDEVDLQKISQWDERRKWIAKYQPVMGEEGDTKAQVLQTMLKGARDHKLEVMEQSLNDAQHGPGGTRVSVEVKVKGAMQDLCEWLTTLEKPEDFYAVSQLSLKVDQDQKSMICTLQLARYFKGGS